jgi:DNA mismatch repair ATPase MutS
MLVLMGGSHCAVAIESWRRRHGAEFARWIDAWAEFEALNALGCYAFECPGDVFPSFETDAAVFDAEALGHPLLPAGACVRNDIRFDGDSARLMVISGSNMSGKSTLMRSIGLGAVLAAAGAPVRARKLRLSLFSTCASLSIQDAIQEGVSRFKAELDRLRETIRLAREKPPVLFLIDEIFSGTNSRDRRVAAEAVVRTLVSAGSVGAISTHDLALAEIADLPGLAGRNVHMGSREGGGPLDFDYLLKPGVSTETNALAIARLAGVPI